MSATNYSLFWLLRLADRVEMDGHMVKVVMPRSDDGMAVLYTGETDGAERYCFRNQPCSVEDDGSSLAQYAAESVKLARLRFFHKQLMTPQVIHVLAFGGAVEEEPESYTIMSLLYDIRQADKAGEAPLDSEQLQRLTMLLVQLPLLITLLEFGEQVALGMKTVVATQGRPSTEDDLRANEGNADNFMDLYLQEI